jgi:hypothetical protein
VVIFGAGETGVTTKRTLEHDTRTSFIVMALVDDDKKKSNGDKDKRKRVGKKSEKAEEEEHENMVREYKKKLFGL